MQKVELTQLIEAGAHFGHLTRRWNPRASLSRRSCVDCCLST